METAIEAIKNGARDYITKPFNIEKSRSRLIGRSSNATFRAWSKTVAASCGHSSCLSPAWLILGIILALLLLK